MKLISVNDWCIKCLSFKWSTTLKSFYISKHVFVLFIVRIKKTDPKLKPNNYNEHWQWWLAVLTFRKEGSRNIFFSFFRLNEDEEGKNCKNFSSGLMITSNKKKSKSLFLHSFDPSVSFNLHSFVRMMKLRHLSLYLV